MDAFSQLGLHPGATEQDVRSAYRALVKRFHPDNFTDKAQQMDAQEKMISLNLAYEEALETAQRRLSDNTSVRPDYAKGFARRLMKQGMPEGALRQLHRANEKDDEWYAIEGEIFMSLRRYQEAHASYRAAVRLSPNNNTYRTGALDAALAMKRQATLLGRVAERLYALRLKREG